MAAENCPFQMEQNSRNYVAEGMFLTLTMPPIPGDINGPRATERLRILDSSDPEEVIGHKVEFIDFTTRNEIPEGQVQWNLFQMTLRGSTLAIWQNCTAYYKPHNDKLIDQALLMNCIEMFITRFVNRTIALDTKEWLRTIQKPRHMKVLEFLRRIEWINYLIVAMPSVVPNSGDYEKPVDNKELAIIFVQAMPQSWRDIMDKSNRTFALDLLEQAHYYHNLEMIENRHYNQRQDRRNEGKDDSVVLPNS